MIIELQLFFIAITLLVASRSFKIMRDQITLLVSTIQSIEKSQEALKFQMLDQLRVNEELVNRLHTFFNNVERK